MQAEVLQVRTSRLLLLFKMATFTIQANTTSGCKLLYKYNTTIHMKQIIDDASLQRTRIIYEFDQSKTHMLKKAGDALESARKQPLMSSRLGDAASLLAIITGGVCFGICAKLLHKIEQAGVHEEKQVLESYKKLISGIANSRYDSAAREELAQANLKLAELTQLRHVSDRNIALMEEGLMSPSASATNKQEQLEEDISKLIETAAKKLLKVPYIDIDRSKEVVRKDILVLQKEQWEVKNIMANLSESEREKNTRALCCYWWNMGGEEVGHAIIVDLCLLNKGKILVFDPNQGLAEWRTTTLPADIEFGENKEPYFESNCIKACAAHCRLVGVSNFHHLNVEMYGAIAHKFSDAVLSGSRA